MSTPDAAFALPVGTVTFLLTDVAGSTQMWGSEPEDAMRAAITRHYELLSEIVDAHSGVRPQEQGEGDSIVAAFARPSDALAAASAAQVALTAEPWPTSAPVRVRMAIHTGEARLRDDANYAGQAIIRTARLRAIGHGGQVLVSGATRDLAVDQTGAKFELRSLGEHRLRDLGRPEHVWQLVTPGVDDVSDPLVSLDTIPNSLPVSLSPFIGRETEIAELAALIEAERLVTATGTGGAGKTRLAQQVGAELIDRFPAGVWWVELAALAADGVDSAVRAAFGISEGAQAALPEAVRRLLDGRPCLLIVDNCEHVTDAVTPLVDDLLRAAPSLRVLATSRVMLDLPGEHAWRVPALGLPEPGAVVPLDVLSQYDAVRLFCDRARRARPNFELSTANGPVVAEICHRLDGIPLAIELAAARTRMLDPQRILDGLDDSFRILAGGSKAVMPRQQTLDASIAWSHDLLTPTEQALLRRLSVFVDGWTLDAAEAVCPDPEDHDSGLDSLAVFDALDRLVDHSLVQTTESPAGLRFGMLETIRQYAQHRLSVDLLERDAVRARHSLFFTEWAISSREELLLGGSIGLLHEFEAERSNLLVATGHAIEVGDSARAAFALHARLPINELWESMSSSLLAQTDRLIDMVGPDVLWKVWETRAWAFQLKGDVIGVFDAYDHARRSAEAIGDDLGVAISTFAPLVTQVVAGIDVLDELCHTVDDIARSGDPSVVAARAHLAVAAAYRGRLDVAADALAQASPQIDGPITQAVADLAAGIIAYMSGDPATALGHIKAALAAPHRHLVVTNLGLGFLVLAGADLGLDLTDEPERILRRSSAVEANGIREALGEGVLATRALLADDLEAARAHIRRAVDIAAEHGMAMTYPHEQEALLAAGHDTYASADDPDGRQGSERLLQRGDPSGALAAALDESRAAVATDLSLLYGLERVSRILTALGRHTEATRVRGACIAFRAERGTVPYACLQRLLDDASLVSRTALGDDDYEAALAEGATLSLAAAVEYARRQRVAHGTTTVGWDALTPTESRVAELVAEGLTNPQVAKELLMGVETVKTHLSRVFDKLGVANRRELILAASRLAAERHR